MEAIAVRMIEGLLALSRAGHKCMLAELYLVWWPGIDKDVGRTVNFTRSLLLHYNGLHTHGLDFILTTLDHSKGNYSW
jgi:hypothetical protein